MLLSDLSSLGHYTVFLPSSFFFSWAEIAHTDCSRCKWISAAQLTFWLQPCLTSVFLSQVLHSNFQECVLLDHVVKTVPGWAVLVKPHTQLAADRSTFKSHQPRLTQEVDLVQGCRKKKAKTHLASYGWAHRQPASRKDQACSSPPTADTVYSSLSKSLLAMRPVNCNSLPF